MRALAPEARPIICDEFHVTTVYCLSGIEGSRPEETEQRTLGETRHILKCLILLVLTPARGAYLSYLSYLLSLCLEFSLEST